MFLPLAAFPHTTANVPRIFYTKIKVEKSESIHCLAALFPFAGDDNLKSRSNINQAMVHRISSAVHDKHNA